MAKTQDTVTLDFEESGAEVFRYDVVWMETDVPKQSGYQSSQGHYFSFRRYSDTQPPVYKVLFDYGDWRAVFSCDTSEHESVFSNFNLIEFSEALVKEIKKSEDDSEGAGPFRLDIIDTLDGSGHPFIY